MAQDALKLNRHDNVATALGALTKGRRIEVVTQDGAKDGIALVDDVPFGFKLATRDIAKGEHILKYGEVIGVASQDIPAGSIVHVHNVDGTRARGDLEQ